MHEASPLTRRLLLRIAVVAVGFGALCVFKYINFFLENDDALRGAMGGDPTIPRLADHPTAGDIVSGLPSRGLHDRRLAQRRRQRR